MALKMRLKGRRPEFFDCRLTGEVFKDRAFECANYRDLVQGANRKRVTGKAGNTGLFGSSGAIFASKSDQQREIKS